MEQTTAHDSAQQDGRMVRGKAWRRSRAGTLQWMHKLPGGGGGGGGGGLALGGQIASPQVERGWSGLQEAVCPTRRSADGETRVIC